MWLTVSDKRVLPILADRKKFVAVFAKQTKKQQATAAIAMSDFDKVKVIGRGGFAEKVYLARKKDTGTLYAIKTMSKAFILEEQGRYEQVFGELEVMRRLVNHPFVIKLYWGF